MFSGDSLTITTFWGDYSAGKVVIICPDIDSIRQVVVKNGDLPLVASVKKKTQKKKTNTSD